MEQSTDISRPQVAFGLESLQSIPLILTAKCNGSCSYCYQTARKNLTMDWAILKAAIDLAIESPSHEITLMFLGGEPLLEWDNLRKAVEYAGRNAPSGKRLKYGISTNGLLLDATIADFLEAHEFSTQLSFDGVESAQDFRKQGSFRALDDLLDRLKQRQPKLFGHHLRVCATVLPATIPYFADSIQYLLAKGVRQIGFSPSLIAHPEWEDRQIEVLQAQFSRIFDMSVRHFRATGEVPVMFFRKTEQEKETASAHLAMCGMVSRRTLAVDADGQVYGCTFLAESYQEFPSDFLRTRLAPMKMGDLRDPDFLQRYAAFPEALRKAEIFDNKEKKYSSYGKCSECRYLSRCALCPVSIGLDPANRDPQRVPDFLCAFNRVALPYREQFPAQSNLMGQLMAMLGDSAARLA